MAEDLVAEYVWQGFTVEVRRRTPDLVQMVVADGVGRSSKVDSGVFWRACSPVRLEIGPVLHPDDAVAGKMDALFNRWAPRDFLDVDAILSSGRYTRDDLLVIAVRHNPGFDSALFAESLSYLCEIPLRDFLPYGASEDSVEAMRERFTAWERELSP
ncbi:hypothetical protein ABGB12_22740 [Actinocorallia sp. B10E7]|uniref:hypothetical protein n=1 Tax=Actinocorallia sp. B10E7 TaxID=3153558 RepID=UPI00325F9391